MADEELTARYREILQTAFRSAAGAPIHDELEESAEASLLSSAERLAAQLEGSILDAPWLRGEILQIVNDWMSGSGDLDFRQLRETLEPLFGASRALLIARSETASAWNGATAAAFRAHGWGHVVWMAGAGACEDCAALDGQVMTIAEYENDPTLHPNCGCTCEPYDEETEPETEEEAAE